MLRCLRCFWSFCPGEPTSAHSSSTDAPLWPPSHRWWWASSPTGTQVFPPQEEGTWWGGSGSCLSLDGELLKSKVCSFPSSHRSAIQGLLHGDCGSVNDTRVAQVSTGQEQRCFNIHIQPHINWTPTPAFCWPKIKVRPRIRHWSWMLPLMGLHPSQQSAGPLMMEGGRAPAYLQPPQRIWRVCVTVEKPGCLCPCT